MLVRAYPIDQTAEAEEWDDIDLVAFDYPKLAIESSYRYAAVLVLNPAVFAAYEVVED